MDFKELILQGESETVEFKESLQLKDEIGETVSALSNSKGGIILIGVSDKKKIKGVQIGKKTVTDLAEYIKRNTDPQIFPEVRIIKIDDKDVVSIKVKSVDEKPVFFKLHAYKRVGNTNQRISFSEIRKLAKETTGKIYWDEQICEKAKLEDIDEKKVNVFLRKAKFERRIDVNSGISTKEILERLNLIKNDKLTNAALLLFGKNPQKFFLQAEVRCARFKGTEPLEFIDMKVFGGNIIDGREDALEFVKEHIKLHAEIKGTERIEKWEYPIEAIREAITNAICHRDYEISSNVQIRIFDDRIEIWGCGLLPEPLIPEDLKKKHGSILRNPLIGKCFFFIKFIEEWGTGTNRMIESCLNGGLPEPIFEEASGSLVVTLRKYYIPEDIESFGLNERQKIAIEFIKQYGMITLRDFKKISRKAAERTLRKDLGDLVKTGIIKPLGEKKGRKYVF